MTYGVLDGHGGSVMTVKAAGQTLTQTVEATGASWSPAKEIEMGTIDFPSSGAYELVFQPTKIGRAGSGWGDLGHVRLEPVEE